MTKKKSGSKAERWHRNHALDTLCEIWLHIFLFLRPLPIRHPSNEVVVWTAFITVLEGLDLKLLKQLQGFERSCLGCVGQHGRYDFTISRRHSLKKKIDCV